MTRGEPEAYGKASADVGVRAAWLYYIEGLTQEQIAQTLGVSRVKVMRLLAVARENGTVHIRIDRKAAEQIELERRLVAAHGLSEAIVVPSPKNPGSVSALVGHAAGIYLAEQVRDGIALAVGWGETLRMMLRGLAQQSLSDASVLSLLGGMTHSRAINPSSVARRVADALGGDCYQLTAPVIVSSAEVRGLLWQEPGLRELVGRVRRADLALVSVGNVSRESTLFRERLLPVAEIASLEQAGAVGDVLCQFIDREGRVIDHPINQRVMAVDLQHLRCVPKVVIAAGGMPKIKAVSAAIKAIGARVLITDISCARGLLRLRNETVQDRSLEKAVNQRIVSAVAERRRNAKKVAQV